MARPTVGELAERIRRRNLVTFSAPSADLIREDRHGHRAEIVTPPA